MLIYCLFCLLVVNNKSFKSLKNNYLLLTTTRGRSCCVPDGLQRVKRTEYVVFLGVKRTEYVVLCSDNGPSMSYF